jgi:DNA repair protein RadC
MSSLATLISKTTGINEEKIKGESIVAMLSRPKSLKLNKVQAQKLEALSEFIRQYNQAVFLNESTVCDSSTRAGAYCVDLFRNVEDKEIFYAVMLNTQNQIIKAVKLFEGTLTETAIYPRELIKEAINNNANAVIVTHNHPGGSLKPSMADINATKNIKTALETVQIKLIDHIICAPYGEYMSFAEKGLL